MLIRLACYNNSNFRSFKIAKKKKKFYIGILLIDQNMHPNERVIN